MVDEEVFADKLRYINEYTEDLREMRGMSEAEYVDDTVTQRAVERTLQILVETCIDLARHIRKTETFTTSETARQEIEALGEAGILSTETR